MCQNVYLGFLLFGDPLISIDSSTIRMSYVTEWILMTPEKWCIRSIWDTLIPEQKTKHPEQLSSSHTPEGEYRSILRKIEESFTCTWYNQDPFSPHWVSSHIPTFQMFLFPFWCFHRRFWPEVTYRRKKIWLAGLSTSLTEVEENSSRKYGGHYVFPHSQAFAYLAFLHAEGHKLRE